MREQLRHFWQFCWKYEVEISKEWKVNFENFGRVPTYQSILGQVKNEVNLVQQCFIMLVNTMYNTVLQQCDLQNSVPFTSQTLKGPQQQDFTRIQNILSSMYMKSELAKSKKKVHSSGGGLNLTGVIISDDQMERSSNVI